MVLKVWKMLSTMARPTAASAAASTTTKRVKAWPVSPPTMNLLKATRLTLAPFSMSSTPIRTATALRRVRTVKRPSVKSSAAMARKWERVGIMASPA